MSSLIVRLENKYERSMREQVEWFWNRTSKDLKTKANAKHTGQPHLILFTWVSLAITSPAAHPSLVVKHQAPPFVVMSGPACFHLLACSLYNRSAPDQICYYTEGDNSSSPS